MDLDFLGLFGKEKNPSYIQRNMVSKYLRKQNKLAKDRYLLDTGTLQCICLFQEMKACLLNTGCLLNRGGHVCTNLISTISFVQAITREA